MASRAHVEPEPRVSRAELLARNLEEEIVESGLEAGARLGTKTDLRHRFGVANGTMNEAVRLLETRGMVSVRPGPRGGVFVAAPSIRVRLNHLVLGFKAANAPFSDCLAVRNALEPLVCHAAAKRCTPRDADALLELVARLEGKIDDPAGFLHVNWALHRYLVRMTRNAPLEAIYLTLLDYVEGGIDRVVGDGHFDGAANLDVHRELVAAIIDGNPDRLTRAIEAHTPLADRWA